MSHTKEFLETVSNDTGRKGIVTPSVIRYAILVMKKTTKESQYEYSTS